MKLLKISKKDKSCMLHTLLSIFPHEEDSVAFALSQCLKIKFYMNAFIRSISLHEEL